MEFRCAVKSDLEKIMEIIRDAKQSLKSANIDQWQTGYPDETTISKDIEKGQSFVLVKDSKIVATAAVTFLEEHDYKGIYEGRWSGSDTYAVIHRLAISSDMKRTGLGDFFLKQIEGFVREKQFPCIRTDTHEDNIRMQKLLVRNGFHFRGLIYIGGKDKRRAFEKILDGAGNEDIYARNEDTYTVHGNAAYEDLSTDV